MNLCDPEHVFITNEMRRFMADPNAMRGAERLLFEAKPYLRNAKLSAEWIIRHLAATHVERAKQTVTLSFDGSFLLWRETGNDKITRIHWRAVSGRPGYQTKEYQALQDKGPLPEGKWLVEQSEYQSAVNRTLWEKAKNGVGLGKWPGGPRSWGLHRVWLHPVKGTNTYGRSGFSIHGGATPGSAGCIDLTDQMDDFVQHFLEYQHDIELDVKYP